MTKVQYESFVNDLHHLSLDIGIRPAARAMGISEDRARKISSRRGFKLALVRRPPTLERPSPSVTAIEAKQQIIQHYGDRAKIGATIAGAKALEHLADSEAHKLVAPANAIAADQWTKAVDRAAGWTQSRAQGVTVNVANIIPPTDAERSDRKAVHAQLDEITRLLAS